MAHISTTVGSVEKSKEPVVVPKLYWMKGCSIKKRQSAKCLFVCVCLTHQDESVVQ